VAALFTGDVVARLAAGSGRGGADGADGGGGPDGGGLRIGVVLSGGNVDLDRLPWAIGDVAAGGAAAAGDADRDRRA
jgi:hypothetical protein